MDVGGSECPGSLHVCMQNACFCFSRHTRCALTSDWCLPMDSAKYQCTNEWTECVCLSCGRSMLRVQPHLKNWMFTACVSAVHQIFNTVVAAYGSWILSVILQDFVTYKHNMLCLFLKIWRIIVWIQYNTTLCCRVDVRDTFWPLVSQTLHNDVPSVCVKHYLTNHFWDTAQQCAVLVGKTTIFHVWLLCSDLTHSFLSKVCEDPVFRIYPEWLAFRQVQVFFLVAWSQTFSEILLVASAAIANCLDSWNVAWRSQRCLAASLSHRRI